MTLIYIEIHRHLLTHLKVECAAGIVPPDGIQVYQLSFVVCYVARIPFVRNSYSYAQPITIES